MEIAEIIKPENQVFCKSPTMKGVELTYCPGCGHGTAHNLLMEAINDLGIAEETIGVAPVGCSVLAYEFMNVDMTQAAHGRAPAVGTAIARLWPEKYVFTYQGDGDLAAIGTAETIHACNRGENMVIIFVNNAIYGMTGGQMAPTSLEGMSTSTSPYGREIETMGSPLKMTELVANLPGVYYATRQAVHTHKHARKAKKAIQKGFQNIKKRQGISFIEIVTNCATGWNKAPTVANEWMEENMFPYFPLGDIKVNGKLK